MGWEGLGAVPMGLHGLPVDPLTGVAADTTWGQEGVDWTWDSGGGGAFDWGSFIPKILGGTTTLISAIKGNPYSASPTGQITGGFGAGQQGGVYAGGSFLGAQGAGSISGTTLLLIGVVAVVLLTRGGGRR